MRKSLLPPLALLAATLVITIWSSTAMTGHTERWRGQLQQADALAQAEDWVGAQTALTDSYDDWSARQTYLHIVMKHDIVDNAESMYHRAMAFAAVREISEFRAEIADLRDQMRLLAEMERFSIKNVL